METVKRKKSPSKSKGNRGEREICMFLSETLGGSFVRVPNSGAFIGGKNSFRKMSLSNTQQILSKGDIIPPDNLPKLVIESKNYKDFSFHQLICDGDCKQLDEWIEQTVCVCDDSDVWFTIFKINNKSTYIVFDCRLVEKFIMPTNYVNYKTFIITEMKPFVVKNKENIITICS